MKRFIATVTLLALLVPGVASMQTVGTTEKLMLKQIAFDFNHKTGIVTRYCLGKTFTSPTIDGVEGYTGTTVVGCLGKNQLEVTFDGKTTQLKKAWDSKTEEQAPVLRGVEVVDGTVKDTLLISFNAAPCLTTNDCGVGMPTNYVSMSYDLHSRRLTNISYPEEGKVIWNTAGTRGVYLQPTCGGAGCDKRAVMGIRLIDGVVTKPVRLSTMKAAYDEATVDEAPGTLLTDVNGTKLTTWVSARWITNRLVEVNYLTTEGKAKKMRLAF